MARSRIIRLQNDHYTNNTDQTQEIFYPAGEVAQIKDVNGRNSYKVTRDEIGVDATFDLHPGDSVSFI